MFRRDAIAMKTVALAAFGVAYAAAPIDGLSLAVIAAGFLLNVSAARALGADRTYYGFELAGLAPVRVDAFPYSLTAHPMLIGNAIAFAGTLLNETFRRDWWPLAVAHVALNLAVLWMETHVSARAAWARSSSCRSASAPRCGLSVAAFVGRGRRRAAASLRRGRLPARRWVHASGAYACALYGLYTASLSQADGPRGPARGKTRRRMDMTQRSRAPPQTRRAAPRVAAHRTLSRDARPLRDAEDRALIDGLVAGSRIAIARTWQAGRPSTSTSSPCPPDRRADRPAARQPRHPRPDRAAGPGRQRIAADEAHRRTLHLALQQGSRRRPGPVRQALRRQPALPARPASSCAP